MFTTVFLYMYLFFFKYQVSQLALQQHKANKGVWWADLSLNPFLNAPLTLQGSC